LRLFQGHLVIQRQSLTWAMRELGTMHDTGALKPFRDFLVWFPLSG
jgi:hypothetical protein